MGKKGKGGSAKVKLTMEKIFNLMDIDADGKITSSDLGTALHSCGMPADKIEIDAYKAVIE